MLFEKAGCRWIVAVMIFTNTCINYMMRVNVSVNIVVMAPVSNATYGQSQNTVDWTPIQRAQIISSYFWGYLLSTSFSGIFAERYGSRVVTLVTVVISAILTILTPAAAKHSYIMMLIVRISIGFFSGFLFPAMMTLIGNWAVPNERGKFIGALVGGTIGTFITWSLCGIIIEAFGWEWGFYSFGIIALLWCIPWWFLIYDTPDMHPRILHKEEQYINEGKIINKEKHFPPYIKIFGSLPVWSFLIVSFGTGWGIYFIITAAPNYLSNALGYKISSTGVLSGTIYLCRSTASFVSGLLGDILLKRKIVSVLTLRRLSTIASHLIPGCLIFCLSISGYSPDVYVGLITLAMTLNGLVSLSSLANPYDLTTHFVGSLSSLGTAVITAAGITSPLVTAYFTKYNEMNADAWKPVFYTGSLVYILSGLQFLLFISTRKQSWDAVQTNIEKIDDNDAGERNDDWKENN